MKRSDRTILVVGTVLATCGATIVYQGFADTRDMTIEQAMALVGQDITPEQRVLVAAAVRRHGLAAIRLLRRMAGESGLASLEAANGLIQFEEALR